MLNTTMYIQCICTTVVYSNRICEEGKGGGGGGGGGWGEEERKQIKVYTPALNGACNHSLSDVLLLNKV